MTEEKKLQLIFSDQFFNSISDLTQEEQQELIDEITTKFNDGSLLEESTPIDLDELPEEIAAQLTSILEELDGLELDTQKRLH